MQNFNRATGNDTDGSVLAWSGYVLVTADNAEETAFDSLLSTEIQ